MSDSELEKLKNVRTRIMACSEFKIFAAIYLKFSVQIIEDDKATAYVTVKGKKPFIGFGRKFTREHNLKKLMFVMLHEMLHFVSGHLSRGLRFDRVLGNMAMDHVVNRILINDINNGSLKNNCETLDTLFTVEELMEQNLTFEAVYDWLIKNKTEYKQTSQSCGCAGCNPSGGNQNTGGGNQQGQGPCTGGGSNNHTFTYKLGNGQTGSYTSDVSPGDTSDTSNEERETLEKDLQDDLRKVANSTDSNLTRGLAGSNLLEFIRDLIKVKVPWDVILENTIKSHVVSSIENREWKIPNKRMRAHGILIPGNGQEKVSYKLVFAIDSSGSVGSDDLSRFLSICKDSLTHFSAIVGIQHDNRITKVVEISRDNIEEGFSDLCGIVGRGGTSHHEVFEYIEHMYQEEDEISLVIFLTDFASDVEEHFSSGKYDWVSEIPIKIVINHSNVGMVPKNIDENPIVIEDDE